MQIKKRAGSYHNRKNSRDENLSNYEDLELKSQEEIEFEYIQSKNIK